jgi:hypothetical protein
MRDYKGKNWTDDDVVGRGKEEKAVGFVCKSQWIKYGIRRKRKGKKSFANPFFRTDVFFS